MRRRIFVLDTIAGFAIGSTIAGVLGAAYSARVGEWLLVAPLAVCAIFGTALTKVALDALDRTRAQP